jgi:uncharacterized integral membrane protein (TIGR00698 family)
METNKPNTGFNVYLDLGRSQSLDSLEGLLHERVTKERGRGPLRFGWQKGLHRTLESAGVLAPGLALAGCLALVGNLTSGVIGQRLLGFAQSPVSPVLVVVVLGLVMRNTIGLPAAFEDGLRFCIKRILRIAVALLGLRMSLAVAGGIGLHALPVVLGCIVLTLAFVMWLGGRLGLHGRLASLIAVGTAICGASAIMATGPAIRAKDEEIGYAIAVITLFGMVALLAYPFFAHWVFAGDPLLVGLFLGTSIHDTSQVVGAGLMYQASHDAPEALNAATTTKLIRNLCMGAVIPLLAILHHRQARTSSRSGFQRRASLSHWLPLFVVGFIAMAAIRSAGDVGERAFGFIDRTTWISLLDQGMTFSAFGLTLAMAAVGLGTDLKDFKRLGFKPLALGLAAALSSGLVALILIQLSR